MCDLRSFSREFITEFIDVYREHPCLWQVKTKEYRNKHKKMAAYAKLVTKLSEVEPECDKDSVTKKINSLRTSFRKEYRKVIESIKTGASAEDIYKPNLWYYHLLLFVVDQDAETTNMYNITDDEGGSSGQMTQFKDEDKQSFIPDLDMDCYSPSDSSISSCASKNPLKSGISKKLRKAEKVSDIVAEKLQRTDENKFEYDNFGKHIAEQMRNISKEQAIYLTKIINDGVFEAQLGSLTRNSRVVSSVDTHTTVNKSSFL